MFSSTCQCGYITRKRTALSPGIWFSQLPPPIIVSAMNHFPPWLIPYVILRSRRFLLALDFIRLSTNVLVNKFAAEEEMPYHRLTDFSCSFVRPQSVLGRFIRHIKLIVGHTFSEDLRFLQALLDIQVRRGVKSQARPLREMPLCAQSSTWSSEVIDSRGLKDRPSHYCLTPRWSIALVK